MPTTANYAIDYDWLADYSDAAGVDGELITARIQTAWTGTNIRNFPPAMLGSQKKQGTDIDRFIPEAHPLKPWLHCTRLKLLGGIGYVDPDATSTQDIKFLAAGGSPGKAVWEAEYSWLGYEVLSNEARGSTELNRYVRRTSSFSSEALSILGKTWKFPNADRNGNVNKPLVESTSKLFPVAQLEYTWFWVPHPLNETVWRAALAKVNNTIFDLFYPTAAYAVETVYFHSWERQDLTDSNGQICSHVTFHFLVRPDGWNKVYRRDKAGGPGFESIVTVNLGQSPYEGTNLNNLFKCPT